MASYRRLPSGLWQAQIFRRGVRASESFPSKGAAIAWAGSRESEIMSGGGGEIPNLTVQALFDRYEKDVSEHKKGKRWEVIRLKAIGRDKLAQVRLRQLDAPHVSDWQQRRLKAVSSASVRRERNLLNNVFNVAAHEWHWLKKNPFGERGKAVRRPKDGRPRTRLATETELGKLLQGASPDLKRAIVAAVETGMRASEIASQPLINGKVATLVDTKNGESREVPLSSVGREVLIGGINLTAGSISTLFARLCVEEKIEGLTFHDLRHYACVQLSKKLTLMELCKMMGWKDPRHALIYYSEGAESIAEKL